MCGSYKVVACCVHALVYIIYICADWLSFIYFGMTITRAEIFVDHNGQQS